MLIKLQSIVFVTTLLSLSAFPVVADEPNTPQLTQEIQAQLKAMQEANDKQFVTLNSQVQAQLQQIQQTLENEIAKVNSTAQAQLDKTQQQIASLQQEVAALKVK